MLELYALGSLLGLGYLFSRKSANNTSGASPTMINVNETPSQNTMYDSSYHEAVQKIEALKAQRSFQKSLEPETTGVINRSFRDQQEFNRTAKKTVKINLSGIEIPQDQFMHNNMTPFFGSRVKQNVEPVANRSVLEKFTGEFAPELWQKKKERKPLFDPMRKDVGNVFGNEVQTDYYKERIAEPRIRNNEKPFEPQRVGPGLNQGYSSKPSGGFQQFEQQNIVRPKTVDELRIGSNPKATFKGRVLAGKAKDKRGQVGDISKNRAETFFENTPERYFTTVGAVTKDTERPEYEVKPTAREETSKDLG